MSEPPDHVRLLAGINSRGNPVYEVVPALAVEPGVFAVLGTPALAFGCAAGDRIRVAEDGSYDIVSRGGNVAVVIFPRAAVDDAGLAELSAALEELDGVAESPEDGRFVVVTVPVAATFSAIESTVDDWARRYDAEWSFGNVYDKDDQPINWWSPTA